jgi:hypothetical protein
VKLQFGKTEALNWVYISSCNYECYLWDDGIASGWRKLSPEGMKVTSQHAYTPTRLQVAYTFPALKELIEACPETPSTRSRKAYKRFLPKE